MMKPSQACVDLVKSFEGFSAHAYPDPGTGGRPWTIGYGTTEHVELGDTVTDEEAASLLMNDLQLAADAVNDLVEVDLRQNQFDALCSFVYNLGRHSFECSTLLACINSDKIAAAAMQFGRWNKANGQVMPGLTRRREAERRLFES